MPYIAANLARYEGKTVGDGQALTFVRVAAETPSPSVWQAGPQVMRCGHGQITKGAVIATMVHGQYPAKGNGNHAAIYISHDPLGIVVLDQYLGHPVGERRIRRGHANPMHDADSYFVVE